MPGSVGIALAVLAVLAVPALLLTRAVRGRRVFGSPAELATYAALHEASLAGPPLRAGLTAAAAAQSAGHLRRLLGSAAVAMTNTTSLLAWDGQGVAEHSSTALPTAKAALATGFP